MIEWLDEAGARAAGGIKWARTPPGTIAAWVAEMDVAVAPAISAALADDVRRHATAYPPLEDDGDLPARLAAWHRRRLGQTIDPARVLYLGDVIAGLAFVADVLLEPGGRIVVPTPAYPPFGIAIRHGRRTMVEVPLVPGGGGHRLDLDGIDSALAAGAGAVLLCNPHNPTGSAPTVDELRSLAAVAERHDALVVSDEVHAPLALPGSVVTPFATAAPEAADRTVTITSVSKAFNLAGLRFAWLVTHDDRLARRLSDVPFYVRAGWSMPGVTAAGAAVDHGDAWLDALRGDIAARHRRLHAALAPLVPDHALALPAASYLAWLDLAGTRIAADPAGAFRAAGVRVSPGAEFGGSDTQVRVNVALGDAALDTAIERMAAALT